MYSDEIFIETQLPEPLSQEKLLQYFEKYKSGDLSAREIIINCNIRLVLNEVLKKFNNVPYDKKELVSIGLMGLVKSVDTFDTSKNIQFSTYAVRCIDNEILFFMRKEKKHINAESFDDILMVDNEGNKLKIKDTLYDEKSDFMYEYEEKELHQMIRKIVDELSARDKEIISLYFGFIDDTPLTQDEIANKLNVCQSYISKLVTNILKKISIQLQRQEMIEKTRKIKTKKLVK